MVREMSWLVDDSPGATPFERAFRLRPDLFHDCRDFAAIFWEAPLLDPTLLELCRIRVGQLVGAEVPALCDAMRAARAALPPAKAAGLADWWNSAAYDDTERACLRFAEQFVRDPKEITDADAKAVTAALGDAGTVALVEVLAILDGFSRFARFVAPEPQP
jgi:alkylhydroperoxidase family enzyme